MSAAALFAVTTPSALADSLPTTPGTPATVSGDPLPTVQIDGVAWSQVVVGTTVYVARLFTTARPAGAAAGVNTTPRSNLLAYDITTGNLITTWAPTVNQQALAIAASPDGSTIYVGGSFDQANGQVRSRIAAFSASTGALVANFKPLAQTSVRALAVTSSNVYFGGDFTTVNGFARGYLAAASVATGGLLPWNPNADAAVDALTSNHSGSLIVIGGRFTQVGGHPWLGLAAVDPVSAAIRPWAVTATVHNYGSGSAILSLASDADGVYGTGYRFGPGGGNLEGSFMANNETGAIIWVEDCHGDSYSVFPTADVVYIASHEHYCGNIGGFWQTKPGWTYFHATAFGKAVTGTITKDGMGYADFAGNPHPELLHFFDKWTIGPTTHQATWTVTATANGNYVAYGGEFPFVNSTAQQGLVRFAKAPLSTNTVAPLSSTVGNYWSTQTFHIDAQSLLPGRVHLSWSSTFDRDNRHLTYKVYRNYTTVNATPVCVVESDNEFWEPRTMSCDDVGQTPGASVKYRVIAFDDFGNRGSTADVSVTVAAQTYSTAYANAVRADSPSSYYRLNEPSGSTLARDLVGNDDMIAFAGVTRGASGALLNEADTAVSLNGTATGNAYGQDTRTAPNTFTVEAWVKTTTTKGGSIIAFGNPLNGSSGRYDRVVYMDNSGRIWFSVNNGANQSVNSPTSYNNNQWHLVTASMGAGGMRLYVDGNQVASNTGVTSAIGFLGDWQVGTATLTNRTAAPSSNSFSGNVDEVVIYPAGAVRHPGRRALRRTQWTGRAAATGRGLHLIRHQPGRLVRRLGLARPGRVDHGLRLGLRRRRYGDRRHTDAHVRGRRYIHRQADGDRQQWGDRHGDASHHGDLAPGGHGGRSRHVRSDVCHRLGDGQHRRRVDVGGRRFALRRRRHHRDDLGGRGEGADGPPDRGVLVEHAAHWRCGHRQAARHGHRVRRPDRARDRDRQLPGQLPDRFHRGRPGQRVEGRCRSRDGAVHGDGPGADLHARHGRTPEAPGDRNGNHHRQDQGVDRRHRADVLAGDGHRYDGLAAERRRGGDPRLHVRLGHQRSRVGARRQPGRDDPVTVTTR